MCVAYFRAVYCATEEKSGLTVADLEKDGTIIKKLTHNKERPLMSIASILANIAGVADRDSRHTKCTHPTCEHTITLPPGITAGEDIARELYGTCVGDAFVSPMGNLYCSKECYEKMGV